MLILSLRVCCKSSYQYYTRERGAEIWEISLLMKACHPSCSYRNILRLASYNCIFLFCDGVIRALPLRLHAVYFQQKAEIRQKINKSLLQRLNQIYCHSFLDIGQFGLKMIYHTFTDIWGGNSNKNLSCCLNEITQSFVNYNSRLHLWKGNTKQ